MNMQGKSAMDVLLAESFKELVQKRPIDKITIKEITDKAGVIRPTFYNHFQDKYELLEYLISVQLLQPTEPLLENGMVNEALTLLFTNLEKEKEFYIQASKLEGQNSFGLIARECVKRIFLMILKKNKPHEIMEKFSWLTPERVAEYYSMSMCSVAIAWIQSGMTVPPKEMSQICLYLMKHSVDEILYGDV